METSHAEDLSSQEELEKSEQQKELEAQGWELAGHEALNSPKLNDETGKWEEEPKTTPENIENFYEEFYARQKKEIKLVLDENASGGKKYFIYVRDQVK